MSTVTLLLNATYEPLCVVSSRRAVILVLSAKAVSLHESGEAMHSATLVVSIPSVVRLTRFVRVPYPAQVPLSRRGVFARDGGRCVYCAAPAGSIDHVVPRSRGGGHTWDNVVAACRRCNHLKADRTLAELGWRLRATPLAPQGGTWRVLGHRDPHPSWSIWLGLPQEQVSA
ncbi:MAG: HNH endonuclease [Geodermatophilaceae bacterium]|nr:HNH endonuclease [Geodermatophilaceae bacterium]